MCVKDLAAQIVTEWDSFGWEQKQRLVEYLKGEAPPEAEESDDPQEGE